MADLQVEGSTWDNGEEAPQQQHGKQFPDHQPTGKNCDSG